MGAFDALGGMGGAVTPLMQVLMAVVVIGIIGAGLYFSGMLDGLMGKYKTVIFCFEKRQGKPCFVGMDKASTHRVDGELTYTLKARKINVPPVPLDYIHLVNGVNYVFMYFPDRDEGHPFAITKASADEIMQEITADKKIETKEELKRAFEEYYAKQDMAWNPIVDDSAINLCTTQLQKNAMRHQSNFEKMMKYMPIIATVVTILVIIIGFWLLTAKMDDMDFTVTCVNTASEAATTATVPFVPEMP